MRFPSTNDLHLVDDEEDVDDFDEENLRDQRAALIQLERERLEAETLTQPITSRATAARSNGPSKKPIEHK